MTQTSNSKVINYGEDDSFQARLLQAAATRSQSHQAADLDANQISIDGSVQKHSREAQKVNKTSHGNRDNLLLQTHENETQLGDASESANPRKVKKAPKTQGNNFPQAAEAPEHPTPNVQTIANKSETSSLSRTTADNSVSVAKASKPPVSKKKLPKPDSITLKTANGNLSGDEDKKEREELLASPVKGSDAQAASSVSQIILFWLHIYILPLCKTLVKLEKTNENLKPKNRSKAELLQLEKDDLITWNNTLEPNYVKYYLSTKSLWSADAKLLEIAQRLYNETLGIKRPLNLTPSSGPIKLVMCLLIFRRISFTFSQLNQKLNEVRNQTGKIAIANLEASFLENQVSL